MEIVSLIFIILALLARVCFMAYFGYKFLVGDKEKQSTLWYGLGFIATLI